MSQFLLVLVLLGLLLTTSGCGKRDESVLPKIDSGDQLDVKQKSVVERDEFIRQAQLEVDELAAKLADIRKKAIAATGKTKAELEQQVLALEQQQKVVEEKLASMKAQIGEKWRELKSGVTEAIKQFKQSLKNAI